MTYNIPYCHFCLLEVKKGERKRPKRAKLFFGHYGVCRTHDNILRTIFPPRGGYRSVELDDLAIGKPKGSRFARTGTERLINQADKPISGERNLVRSLTDKNRIFINKAHPEIEYGQPLTVVKLIHSPKGETPQRHKALVLIGNRILTVWSTHIRRVDNEKAKLAYLEYLKKRNVLTSSEVDSLGVMVKEQA